MTGPSIEEVIIARLDSVIDALPPDATSYQVLRAVGPFPPRHVSATAHRRIMQGGSGSAGGPVSIDWRDLDLQPGFGIYGDARFATPKYRLTSAGLVHLEGMLACVPPLSEADVGKLICTLDGDCCPSATLLFGCAAYGNNARIDVEADGSVRFQGMLMGGGQIDWFTLSPVTFSVGG
jgi:hypothetical protein